MESSTDRVELHAGMEVVSLDGDKIGKAVAVDNNQITVEKGFFFPTDYIIPLSAVDSADDDTMYLNISKDDALNQRWSASASTLPTEGVVADDAGAGAGGRAGMFGDTPLVDASGTAAYDASTAGATASADDTMTIPVHEEELTATTRPVQAGEVRINKDVVTEERTLDVPVTEERVRVTRRAVDRAATGDEAAFEGGTIDVPVQSEQVDMQKRVRVAEEVEVAKEAVQKTQQVAGTVRREVVQVNDNTDTDVIDGTTGTTAAGSNS